MPPDGRLTVQPAWPVMRAASVVAAAAVLVSPWCPVSSLSFAVVLWLMGVLSLFGGGGPMVFWGDPTWLMPILVAAGTLVTGVPWLGLASLFTTRSKRFTTLCLAPVGGLVLVASFGWAGLAELRATGRAFGPWHLAGIASVSILGIAISLVGARIVAGRPSPKLKTLGWVLIGSGVSFAVWFPLPLGVLGLGLAYLFLGLTVPAAGRSPRA